MRGRRGAPHRDAHLVGTLLTLDVTASRLRVRHLVVPDAVVLTFWMQFRNESAHALRDVRLLQCAFTSDGGDPLDYDEPPVTVVGRAGRVDRGAGFVTVGRYTATGLDAPRRISNDVEVRGGAADGLRFSDRTTLQVVIGADAAETPAGGWSDDCDPRFCAQ
ncbi:hypothetical protein SAMN06295885_3064 [Rathayibacter oskolensis]|uniref:Uncharacterized protein n=1 Tax=Rathayibacter oskolensis TaxID=1891671 RepID=A0A1X7PBK6_9MICO|nr:hypothetical protein [Rathayibacter oskolensis]SMH48554.1 hypothetical protein SAMN06295885_3064 [Rathayibacter oskolensis]